MTGPDRPLVDDRMAVHKSHAAGATMLAAGQFGE